MSHLLLATVAATAALNGAAAGLDVRALPARIRATIDASPAESIAATVLGAAWLFFLAERGANPKVRTFLDALVFVTTCLSVGYADTFARTPAGKAIASALMTFGPALSARALDAGGPDHARATAFQEGVARALEALPTG